MITTYDMYKLEGSSGFVVKYEDDAYFIDSTGAVFLIAPDIFQALEKGYQLIPHVGLFERTSEEMSALFYSDWRTSSIHRELYQANVRTEPIICGDKLFYVKKSFLEDFPDNTYTFATEDGIALKISTEKSRISSYMMLETTDIVGKASKLAYISRFDGVRYTPLWLVTK